MPINELEKCVAFPIFMRYVYLYIIAMATVTSDIFKPSKFGGKYTVTLIPGTAQMNKSRDSFH